MAEDGEAVAEADEEEDVDDEPGHPGGEAAPMGLEGPDDIRDRGLASDGGHVALVEVVEGLVLAGAIAAEVLGDQAGDAPGGVGSHLHGRLGDAGKLPAVLFHVGEVAADEDLRVAGRVEVLVDEDGASAVGLEAQQLAEGGGLDAGGPEGDDGIDTLVADHDVAGLDVGDMGARAVGDAKRGELLAGLLLKVGGVGAEDVGRALEDEDLGHGGVDVAKIFGHVELGDVADCAGQLDAGGAAADDDEVEGGMAAGLLHLALGEFEGEEDAAADLGGVLDGLEAGGELGPVVFAEVGVGGTGGDDEVVVLEHGAGLELDVVLGKVEADGLVHEDFDVLMVAQDGADGLRDVGGREDGKRDLVEQGLEDVVVLAVDQGDVDGELCEVDGGVDAGKAAAEDYNAFAYRARYNRLCSCHRSASP